VTLLKLKYSQLLAAIVLLDGSVNVIVLLVEL
jgi:hypothetical protein